MGAKGVMMMIRVTTPPQTGKRGIQNRIKVLVDVDIITRLVSLCVFQALSAISMPIIFDARRLRRLMMIIGVCPTSLP